jgi:hypothetical protein
MPSLQKCALAHVPPESHALDMFSLQIKSAAEPKKPARVQTFARYGKAGVFFG